MKKTITIITLISLSVIKFTLISCKSKPEFKNCNTFNDKYIEYRKMQNNDSALFYIQKAIECDSNDDFYKLEKIKFYIFLGKYESLLTEMDKLELSDIYINQFIEGIINLKIDNKELGVDALNKAYIDLKKQKKSDYVIYKISLDNYFKGGKFALNEIEKAKIEYKENNYTILLLKDLEKSINTKSKEEVLFTLFNVR